MTRVFHSPKNKTKCMTNWGLENTLNYLQIYTNRCDKLFYKLIQLTVNKCQHSSYIFTFNSISFQRSCRKSLHTQMKPFFLSFFLSIQDSRRQVMAK